MEYKILKRSIKLTLNTLRDASLQQNSEPSIVNQFSIVDCGIVQHNKLFKVALDDGELTVMQSLIRNNFTRERLMIQNTAIKIYRVTRPVAIDIIYDMWKRSIDEYMRLLHNDYEDVVINCSGAELYSNQIYQRALELFGKHQEERSIHDELFMEAKTDNNVDNMNHAIAFDIPQELKIVQEIRDIISRL